MRFGGRRTSSNVESGGRGGGFRGGGGGGMGLLMNLVASRFGIGGIIVLMIGAMVLGFNPFGGGGSSLVGPNQQAPEAKSAAEVCAIDAETHFACQVLASTEDQWGRLFAASGQTYQPTVLHIYDRSGNSGCGAAQAAMGPFYCPTDQRIYLDTSFFDELAQRYGAAGDFAQAYVVAHEVGHHVQNLTGTLDEARSAQSRLSAVEGNAVQVQVELQADCYAGVWAAGERAAIEPGDIQEGMTAASAIGDDTLQRQTQGRVVPESFTHGTSEQRMAALRRGLETGDPNACVI